MHGDDVVARVLLPLFDQVDERDDGGLVGRDGQVARPPQVLELTHRVRLGVLQGHDNINDLLLNQVLTE